MILTNLIIILKIMGLAWFITRFAPLQWFLDAIIFNLKPKKPIIQLTFKFIEIMITCSKCAAFWIGLFMGGIWLALIASFTIFWYDKFFLPIENKITLPV